VIDPGVVGSPIDVVTLVTALVTLHRVRESQDDGHAVTTALARMVEGVDDDRVAADLDAAGSDVEQYLRDDGAERPKDEHNTNHA